MLQLSRAQVLAGALLVLALCALALAVRARRFAGRSDTPIGAWRIGLSQAVSAYSLWAVVGICAAAYLRGLAALWIVAGIFIGAALNALFVGPRLRSRAPGRVPFWLEATGTSAPDGTSAAAGDMRRGGMRPEPSAGAAGIVLVILILALVAQLRIAGLLVAQSLGIATAYAVAMLGILAFLPALVGGRRAAIDLGALVAIVLIPILAAVLLPALLFAGYFGDVLRNTAAASAGAGDTGLLFVLVALVVGFALPGQPHVLDQFGATADARAARRAGWFSLAWHMMLAILALLIGWSARVLYSQVGTPDQLLSELAQRLLPPALHGLPALAVAAAVCASAGHQLLAAGQAAAPQWLALADGALRPVRECRIHIGIAIVAIAVAATVDFGSSRVVMFALVALGAVIAPSLLANLAGLQWRRATVALTVRAGLIVTLALFLAGRLQRLPL